MTVDRPLRVAVVDDELLARQRLEDLLGQLDRVGTVLSADSGRAATELIREREPDLVFLDMQMPGMSGLDVVRTVGPEEMPVAIFVTAHDQFAVEAFEVAALDYLLKPFDDRRFHQAFDRAVRHLELKEMGGAAQRLVDLLEARPGQSGVQGPAGQPGTQPGMQAGGQHAGRIAVDVGGATHVVPVEDISHVTAAGPYAELHTRERTYILRERMQNLEDRLVPEGFFRIHRSSLVRLDRIEALDRGSGGDYSLRLKDGTELSVSRARIKDLERRLGVER